MEGHKKPTSPHRPRGPSAPNDPQIAREHAGPVNDSKKNYAGSSRSSLFGLFRRQPKRQPSHASLRPQTGSTASTASVNDSFYGAFDNMSLDMSVNPLESPQQAKDTGRKVENMLAAAAKYRKAMETLSEASAEFGNTLYECAHTKGAASGTTSLPDHHVDSDLQASGGLHLLISNHANLLASSLEQQLELPIQEDHKQFKEKLQARESEFRVALRQKTQALNRADGQRHRSARRNLAAYRSTLLDLTSQIDDISRLKFEFLGDLHAYTTDLAESLHASMASTVTAEIEVFESIARKGWSGGGLDGLLAGCPDPFSEPRGRQTLPVLQRNGGVQDAELVRSAAPDWSNGPISSGAGATSSGAAGTNAGGSGGNTSNNSGASSSGAGSNGLGSSNLSPATSPHRRVSPRRSPGHAPTAGSAEGNLFSIIPPKPFLPRREQDEASDDDASDDDKEATNVGSNTQTNTEANAAQNTETNAQTNATQDATQGAAQSAAQDAEPSTVQDAQDAQRTPTAAPHSPSSLSWRRRSDASNSSELANLTLTPLKVNSNDESD